MAAGLMQEVIVVQTRGRGAYDLTPKVRALVSGASVEAGLAHVFVKHTSASLMLCENADPDVRRDLETFMSGLVVDGDRRFLHRSEGPDDMSAHVRSVLTGMDLTIPVTRGQLQLGVWQGVYLWEHRTAGHHREIVVTVVG